ncbi:probable G-protein coupled receptor 148 [Rhinatrema bivittatum]|uniref:probable G-protein coupled receptor 148 n=1 Tax=Rhinatrema bivittatum TaxID=194408 RepID=UPI00112A4EAD|nr:probable G-protein coupled receptor 148 [Rhinatrema bivittatum]
MHFQRELHSNRSLMLAQPYAPLLREWVISSTYWEMNLFVIPTLLCLLAAAVLVPSILFVIFSSAGIRQEIRFLLLGNALFSDLVYLIFYSLITVLNAANLKLPRPACELLLFLLALTYCAGLLTAAAMVLDTYLAVLWPLHYISVFTPSRAKKLILLLWLLSCFFPAMILLVLCVTQKAEPCPVEVCSVPVILVMMLHGDDVTKFCYIILVTAVLLCLTLILCCYITLCFKTRDSGIWKGVSSRASVTFLMHHTILFFYFCPLLLLIVETLLYVNKIIGLRTGLWVTLTICNVLVVLPKALSPYLYGLRYREIANSLKLIFRLKRVSLVSPALALS